MYVSTKKYGHDQGFSCCFRQWRAMSHCNKLHGYALAFEFTFEADTLDSRNWVEDFGSLKPLKEKLAYWFDHTTLVAKDDPLWDCFKRMDHDRLLVMRELDAVGCEKVAEFVWNLTNDFLNETKQSDRVRIRSVQVWEHEGNSARFEK